MHRLPPKVAPHEIEVETRDGKKLVRFEHAIIAAGSEAITLPFIPASDPRVIDSTGALEVEEVPGRLLVIGGGIIGLEMATVYHELGAQITVVELLDQLIPGADRDVVAPLAKRVSRQYENVFLRTRVTGVEARPEGLGGTFDGAKAPATDTFDRILVAVGRRPNGSLIGAERAGVTVDPAGFIPVSKQLRTSVPHIFAIGDLVGQPMLAHKAMHEAKVAAIYQNTQKITTAAHELKKAMASVKPEQFKRRYADVLKAPANDASSGLRTPLLYQYP